MYEPAIIVGAGPAGLATAAMLRRRGIDALVLERNAAVGGAWRGRYDTLRLHTVRQLSNLPGTPLPRTDGRFVSRDAFVHYLEGYAGQHAIRMLPETDVRRIGRSGAGFRVITADGPITTAAVVVATGYCHTPAIPGGRAGAATPGGCCTRRSTETPRRFGSSASWWWARATRDPTSPSTSRARARARCGYRYARHRRSCRARCSDCRPSLRGSRCGGRPPRSPTPRPGSSGGSSSAISPMWACRRRATACSRATAAPTACPSSTSASPRAPAAVPSGWSPRSRPSRANACCSATVPRWHPTW